MSIVYIRKYHLYQRVSSMQENAIYISEYHVHNEDVEEVDIRPIRRVNKLIADYVCVSREQAHC